MSRVSFENFGKLARSLKDPTLASGRYSIQEGDKKKITGDVIKKLELKPEDRVLEIGCGVGDLLIPLSFFVKEITGIDHESCLKSLCRRLGRVDNIRLIQGNFFDICPNKAYDKILCYSVIQYIKDKKEVFNFIDKALRLLTPGGMALFGDIPNQSTKERFLNSEHGRQFVKEWQVLMNVEKSKGHKQINLTQDKGLARFDDNLTLAVLKKFRLKGYHTYILAQPPDLPFGNTREDILIVKTS